MRLNILEALAPDFPTHRKILEQQLTGKKAFFLSSAFSSQMLYLALGKVGIMKEGMNRIYVGKNAQICQTKAVVYTVYIQFVQFVHNTKGIAFFR